MAHLIEDELLKSNEMELNSVETIGQFFIGLLAKLIRRMGRKNPGHLGINFEIFFDQGARRAHFTQSFRKPDHGLACARRNVG